MNGIAGGKSDYFMTLLAIHFRIRSLLGDGSSSSHRRCPEH